MDMLDVSHFMSRSLKPCYQDMCVYSCTYFVHLLFMKLSVLLSPLLLCGARWCMYMSLYSKQNFPLQTIDVHPCQNVGRQASWPQNRLLWCQWLGHHHHGDASISCAHRRGSVHGFIWFQIKCDHSHDIWNSRDAVFRVIKNLRIYNRTIGINVDSSFPVVCLPNSKFPPLHFLQSHTLKSPLSIVILQPAHPEDESLPNKIP